MWSLHFISKLLLQRWAEWNSLIKTVNTKVRVDLSLLGSKLNAETHLLALLIVRLSAQTFITLCYILAQKKKKVKQSHTLQHAQTVYFSHWIHFLFHLHSSSRVIWNTSSLRMRITSSHGVANNILKSPMNEMNPGVD